MQKGKPMTFINWNKPFELELGNEFLQIPTYGNYGGANYSSGKFGEDPPLDENGSYLSNKELDDNKDAADYQFYKHDVDELLANTPAEDRAADVKLVRRLDLSDKQLDDPEAELYAGVATVAFSARLLVNNPRPALAEKLVPYLEDALDNIEAGLLGLSLKELNQARSVLEENVDVLQEIDFPGTRVDAIIDDLASIV